MLLYFIVTFYISGCGSKSAISLQEYFELLHKKESYITATDSSKGIIISAKYLPPSVMALQEAGRIDNLKSQYQNLIKNYEDADYFEYTLTKGNESTRKYLQKLFNGPDSSQNAFEEYIDFGIQNDIKLVIGSDTLQCAYLHREISEAMSNKLTYTLSFVNSPAQNSSSEPDRIIILNSSKLRLENIKLKISGKQIESLPPLKL